MPRILKRWHEKSAIAALVALFLAAWLVPGVQADAAAVPASQLQSSVQQVTAPAITTESWKIVKTIPNRASFKVPRIVAEQAGARMRASYGIPPTYKGGKLGAAQVSASSATRTVFSRRWLQPSAKDKKNGIYVTTPETFPAIAAWRVDLRADYIFGSGKSRRVEHVKLTYTHPAPKNTTEKLVGIFTTLVQDYESRAGHEVRKYLRNGMVQYRIKAPIIELATGRYDYMPREAFSYNIDLAARCIRSLEIDYNLDPDKFYTVTAWFPEKAEVNIETTVTYRLNDGRSHLSPPLSHSTIRNHKGTGKPMIGHADLPRCPASGSW